MMATTYTCDRCSKVLNTRESVDGGSGAHRLKVTDCIPWVESSTHSSPGVPTTDLCGACFDDLLAWLKDRTLKDRTVCTCA